MACGLSFDVACICLCSDSKLDFMGFQSRKLVILICGCWNSLLKTLENAFHLNFSSKQSKCGETCKANFFVQMLAQEASTSLKIHRVSWPSFASQSSNNTINIFFIKCHFHYKTFGANAAADCFYSVEKKLFYVPATVCLRVYYFINSITICGAKNVSRIDWLAHFWGYDLKIKYWKY